MHSITSHRKRSQSAAAANDPHSDKTLAASQNLQELCAKGPRRTTPDLIRALEVPVTVCYTNGMCASFSSIKYGGQMACA
ncbi:hypothetical protein WJX77_005586 [Trebouxia sp. C0004]